MRATHHSRFSSSCKSLPFPDAEDNFITISHTRLVFLCASSAAHPTLPFEDSQIVLARVVGFYSSDLITSGIQSSRRKLLGNFQRIGKSESPSTVGFGGQQKQREQLASRGFNIFIT